MTFKDKNYFRDFPVHWNFRRNHFRLYSNNNNNNKRNSIAQVVTLDAPEALSWTWSDVKHPALDTLSWYCGAVNIAAVKPLVALTMPTHTCRRRQIFHSCQHFLTHSSKRLYRAGGNKMYEIWPPPSAPGPHLTLPNSTQFWPQFLEKKFTDFQGLSRHLIVDPYFSNFQESVATPSKL